MKNNIILTIMWKVKKYIHIRLRHTQIRVFIKKVNKNNRIIIRIRVTLTNTNYHISIYKNWTIKSLPNQ